VTVEKPKIQDYRRHLLVCVGPRCAQEGESQKLFDTLGERFKAAGLDQGSLRVKRTRVHCFAACRGGPVMAVQPDGIWYYNVTPENMDRIIQEHLVGGRPVEELVFHRGPEVPEGREPFAPREVPEGRELLPPEVPEGR
jgi:(2Fe-2S) ferredoxin